MSRVPIGFNFLKKEVIEKGLCVGCGTCIGVCPENILVSEGFNRIAINGLCTKCGICVKACPGKQVDFSKLNQEIFHDPTPSPLGHFEQAYIACSNDDSVRHSSSSGGVVSSILTYMLDNNIVDGAIVADYDDNQPLVPHSKIAYSSEEVLKASGSKYMLYPHNIILKTIKTLKDKKLAFVGLPCHIHAIRKLEQISSPSVSSIHYCIGLYCGLGLSDELVQGFKDRYGIKDTDKIESIKYRKGVWPGDVMITMKNKKIHKMSKFCFNYFNFLYTPNRCLMCIDMANEFCDISVGDGWQKEGSERVPGWSVVLTRNKKSDRLFRNELSELIDIEQISRSSACKMHSHVLNNKKQGSFIRMNIANKKGAAIPEYDVECPKISRGRILFERLNLLILWFGRKKITRRIVNRIPLPIMEKSITFLRTFLKKVSRNDFK